MPSHSPEFSAFCFRARFYFLAPLLLLMALLGNAHAVPPRAPTGVGMTMTRLIDSATSGNLIGALFHLRWQDNAVDEDGYLIRVRLVQGGRPVSPWSVWSYEPADSEEEILSLGPLDTRLSLQAQVIAYKFNGNRTEVAPGRIVTTAAQATNEFNAPTGLTASLTDNDAVINLAWDDNARTEVYYLLSYRLQGGEYVISNEARISLFGQFGRMTRPVFLNLPPGSTYNMRMRAEREINPTLTNYSNEVTVTFPAMAAPTNLRGRLLDATTVRLEWEDNSVKNTSYRIEYRDASDSGAPFTTLGTLGGFASRVDIPVDAGADFEWRVVGVWEAQGFTSQETAPTNTVITRTPDLERPPSPTNVSVTQIGLTGSALVRWTNPWEDAVQVRVFSRVADDPGSTFTQQGIELADEGRLILRNLPLDTPLEFALIADAFTGSGSVSSALAQGIAFTPRIGLDPASYHANFDPDDESRVLLTPIIPQFLGGAKAVEIRQGELFSHTLELTDASDLVQSTVDPLPPGLDPYDVDNLEISGTPTQSGVFRSQFILNYSDDRQNFGFLAFRVQPPQNAPPVVSQALGNRTVSLGEVDLSLAGVFTDPDAPRAARVTTPLGQMNIALLEQIAPHHVANFLAYANAGDYDGVAFHRASADSSGQPFVIQGGGFKPESWPNFFATVPKRPSPINEPGVSNLRGTIAAAKLGNAPNSATTDFFVSLNDENAANLDQQNGGFTVFGRVAADGMAVADAIYDLPRGSFEIFLDGNFAQFSDWPINDTELPEEMDTGLVVGMSVVEISPLHYEVTHVDDTDILTAEIVDGQLKITGLQEGATQVTVKAIDLDGHEAEDSFLVTVDADHVNVVINDQPQDVTVAAGSPFTLSVGAAGSGLSFQWRRDGEILTGEMAATLSVAAANESHAGVYDVLVTGGGTTLVSAAASVVVTSPAMVIINPVSALVASGQPHTLAAAAVGFPAPGAQWFKDGESIDGAVQSQLVLPMVTAASAGFYSARFSNGGGTDITSEARLVVVDGGESVTVVRGGGNAVLEVAVFGAGDLELSYQWLKPDGLAAVGGKFSGGNTSRLTISGVDPLDAGVFTCVVNGPGAFGGAISGGRRLAVAAVPEVLPLSLPTGQIGVEYEYAVPFNESAAQTPASFAARGLPPGLTIDRTTGVITGTPRRAGSFTVRVTAANPRGTSAQRTGVMEVLAAPAGTIGSFVGMVGRNLDVNGDHGGRVDLAVMDSGAFSGRITLVSGVLTFRGNALLGQNQLVARTTIPRRGGLAPLVLTARVANGTGVLTGTLALEGGPEAPVNGWRRFWDARHFPATQARFGYLGRYAIAMRVSPAQAGDPAAPQGGGYATINVVPSGMASIAGVTPDGVRFTCSAHLSVNGRALVFQRLYRNTGIIQGGILLFHTGADQDNVITHTTARPISSMPLTQSKGVQPVNARAYQGGFNPALALQVSGGRLIEPSETAPSRGGLARIQANGSFDPGFRPPPLTDGPIFAMLRRSDGNIWIGGSFSRVNGMPRNNVALISENGVLVESFDPGTGPSAPVLALAEDSSGRLLIGGGFTNFGETTVNGIARLEASGARDTTFSAGTGLNGACFAIALQGDGRIVIGGEFTRVNSSSADNRQRVARLNVNGSLDNTFNPVFATQGNVRAIVVQPDQQILIGGDFIMTGGHRRIARLTSGGIADNNFNLDQTGANAPVRCIALQPNGKILIGGDFTQFNGVGSSRVCRLNANGTRDGSFNPAGPLAGSIRALQVIGGSESIDSGVLAAGQFVRVGSASADNANGLVRLQANGALEPSFLLQTAGATANRDLLTNAFAMTAVSGGRFLAGGWVRTRIGGTRILGLTPANPAARLVFSGGGMEGETQDPSMTFQLTAANRIGAIVAAGTTPALPTFTVNPRTGIFSGTFRLTEGGNRLVRYTGLLVPETPEAIRGIGNFPLPARTAFGPTLPNAPIRYGRVDLSPAP